MSNAVLLDAIKKCRANHAYWTKTVLVQRPNAAQEIAPYLSGGGDAFSGLLDGFSSRLEAMSARPRISATLPTSQLQLICIHAQTIYVNMQSHTNGLEWLLQNTGFANSISCLDQLLKSLERTDKKENDALLDVAQARLSSELKTFQDGSAYFANLLQRRETVEGVLEKLEGAEDEIDKTLDQLTKSAAAANVAIAASNKGVETAASELSGKIDEQKAALEESESTVEAISLLRKAAEKEATESNEKLEASDQNLVAASTAQKDASDRLKAALRDVQREGLAGAFTQKAEAIAKQATTQQWIFGGAVTYLAVVATLPWVIEAWNGLNPSVEQFGLRFMRTLAIAAPGIWIGWVSSRKLGALNRILADYEYKSATALAYESYRKEVDDAGNDSLREKLLATAIENFGENPTEHYESAKAEPAAPIEAITAKLLERLPTLSTKQAVS